MLKIRLMGTKNDIRWFEKILRRQPKIILMDFSELYQNKGTNKYYRAYAEVHKANLKRNRTWRWKSLYNAGIKNSGNRTVVTKYL